MQTNTAEATETQSAAFSQVITDQMTVTETAAEKMKELFQQVDDEVDAIRVFVSGGGCSGMGYGMTFTDTQEDSDCVLQMDGYKILVDAVALSFLDGVEIDFVDHGGPAGASFVFNNAFQASGGGGCGTCGSSGGGCS